MRGRRTLLTSRFVVGHLDGRHVLFPNGQVVFEGDRIVFVGHNFQGEVEDRRDYGTALIGPGFIDLDALSDLDTTILGFDNQPAHEKGRVWPHTYMERGPVEMYSPDELAFQKKYAFAQLLRNGITTAMPIASLFYREWGETTAEFSAAAEAAAELGLRVYLGPAYRTGNTFVNAKGEIDFFYNEPRGLAGLEDAIAFCRAHENTHAGLIRTVLAPDRIETCTQKLLSRSSAAADDLDVPIRLHCCQSKFEYEAVVRQHGVSPPEWLYSFGFLKPRAILPHGTWVSGTTGIVGSSRDIDLIRESGASIVHCPIVSARGGRTLQSFAKYRKAGLRIAMGTDTWPPDMIQNLQTGLLLCRVTEGNATCVRASDYYDAATTGGADALARPDLGRLAVGAKADIVVIDFNHPDIGQVIDPIQTLLIGASGRDVHSVIVDGRFVMENRAIPGLDMQTAHLQAQSQFDRLVARYPERTWKHPPVEQIFTPSYPTIS